MGGRATGCIERSTSVLGWHVANEITSRLSLHVERYEVAGSLRREQLDIGDVDICVVPEGGDITLDSTDQLVYRLHQILDDAYGEKAIVNLSPWVKVRKGVFKPKCSWNFPFPIGDGKKIQVDVLASRAHEFESNLLFFTGSAAFNVRMRQLAIDRSWRLSNYGLLTRTGDVLATRERKIFELLGMDYVEPKDRD